MGELLPRLGYPPRGHKRLAPPRTVTERAVTVLHILKSSINNGGSLRRPNKGGARTAWHGCASPDGTLTLCHGRAALRFARWELAHGPSVRVKGPRGERKPLKAKHKAPCRFAEAGAEKGAISDGRLQHHHRADYREAGAGHSAVA